MGFGPDQVDQWEPYQVTAVYRNWKAANTAPSGPKPPSDERYREAMSKLVH